MIVADTGAVIAMIDADDHHHHVLRDSYEQDPDQWVLPWAVLPEVDYIVSTSLGDSVAQAFRTDLARGAFIVEWGVSNDLVRAHALNREYASLRLGLVDAVVMSMAERLQARAIATLDIRDFAAVTLDGSPALWPRDLT